MALTVEKEKAPEGQEQISLRLPVKLADELKQEAYKRGQSLNGYIIHLIGAAREAKQKF